MSEEFVAQLERRGISHQLVDHPPITTIAQVAGVLRVSPQVLVKVMLFQDNSTQRLIVALLPGHLCLESLVNRVVWSLRSVGC